MQLSQYDSPQKVFSGLPFSLPDTGEKSPFSKKLRIETYGCQMNVADSETVAAIMEMAGYTPTENDEEANAVLINTCSIRDNAEQKIYGRLAYWRALRKKLHRNIIIGVILCLPIKKISPYSLIKE